MIETLTVYELREALAKLPAFDSDHTNVVELRILPVYKRVQVLTDDCNLVLTEQSRNLIAANGRLLLRRDALKKEIEQFTMRLKAIRNQCRRPAPKLP